jgi:hypothetical protein
MQALLVYMLHFKSLLLTIVQVLFVYVPHLRSSLLTIVQAIVFVRDLDRSFLGSGDHGLKHYKSVQRGTDLLVNCILHLRRLLKQKRSCLVEGFGAPLPDLCPRSPTSKGCTSLMLSKGDLCSAEL